MADYRLGALSLAATNVDQMAGFYSGVFGIEFEEEALEGGKVFGGQFAGMEFALVSAELAGVTAEQNRMHLDIFVPDIHQVIEATTHHGGRTNGQLREDDEVKCIGIFDPDDNFIVIKEKKQAGQR